MIHGLIIQCGKCDYETSVKSGVTNYCDKCGKKLMSFMEKDDGTLILDGHGDKDVTILKDKYERPPK